MNGQIIYKTLFHNWKFLNLCKHTSVLIFFTKIYNMKIKRAKNTNLQVVVILKLVYHIYR